MSLYYFYQIVLKMKYKKVPLEVSLHMRYLHQDMGMKTRDIKKYPQYSKSSIYRHANKSLGVVKEQKNKGGRPTKMSVRDQRILRKYVYRTNSTFRYYLNKLGFRYLQTRKKGLLSSNDLKDRLKFAKQMLKNYSSTVWTDEINFYLDGTSFQHKFNPKDQARAPHGREWRKPSEGLKKDCTSKGAKVGSGGRVAHFIMAISYKCGTVVCQQYERMNGKVFTEFVKNKFPEMFSKCRNPDSKLFLQDGDPSQNCKAARKVMESYGVKQISIPARSPDINPIENFFNLISSKLQSDAIGKNITHEIFEQFSERIMTTITSYSVREIDKIIESMHKRMKMIVKNKGERLKY